MHSNPDPFLQTKLCYFLHPFLISLTPLEHWGRSRKIVPTHWLAERSVCMRVCIKHGCDLVVTSRCFAFRALITQAWIWKRFWVQTSTSLLYLPTPLSAETWNIFTNKLCQFCFLLSSHFKRELNPYFRRHLFAKQELIMHASLCVHDFATGKNFSFNQCHNKEFYVFLRKVIL